MMKKSISLCIVFSTFVVFGRPALAAIHTFDDFSSLTTDPQLSGYLSDAGFEVTFWGDDGAVFTDLPNGSLNSLILGDNVPADRTTQLTLSFNMPVIELAMEFDAMHLIQHDQVTASIGTWTDFPATLSLCGRTLSSTANVIELGGSGIDDDLLTILVFGTPIHSVTFTSVGAFTLDSIAVEAIPEPTTVFLLGLGGLTLLRKRRQT